MDDKTLQIQLALEQRGIDIGKANYVSQLTGRTNAWTGTTSKRTEADMPPGQALMARACGPVALQIESFYSAFTDGRAGPGLEAAELIAPIAKHRGFECVAYLTLKSLMSNIGETRTRALMSLSNSILDELRMIAFEHGHREELDEHGNPVPLSSLFKFLVEETRRQTGSRIHQKRVLGVEAARHGIGERTLSNKTKLRVGGELLSAALTVTGWFEVQERLAGHGRTEHYIEATDEFASLLRDAHDLSAMMAPVWPVSVVKPKDWTGMWDGAYQSTHLSSRLPLVKIGNPTTLRELHGQADAMPGVLSAVNALQATAYRINPFVLEFVKDAWSRRIDVAGLPPQERLPEPNLRKEAPELIAVADTYKGWASGKSKSVKDWVKVRTKERHALFAAEHPDLVADFEQFQQWKASAKKVWNFNDNPRRIGDLLECRRTLSMAEELHALGIAFFFPHQLDFRGRAYTVPLHLNPQGSDLSKGLLMFSDGKALGERGVRALAVHGANSWDQGLTKQTFLARIQWVMNHTDLILQTAQDPWSTRSWWEQTDAEGNLLGAECPLQFLAFCKEWQGVAAEGSDYVSALPVAADGSCNGIQWWGLLLMDETVAEKVNLVDTEEPGDIYGDVARYVAAKVAADAASTDATRAAMGAFWSGQVSRSLVKRNVMTKAYGLTAMGARKQLKDELKKNGKTAGYRNADKPTQKLALKYLADAVQEGIRHEVKAAAVGMEFMQVVAEYLAQCGVPLHWSTPDGFIVWQGYKKKSAVKIQTTLHGSLTAPRVMYVNEEVDPETGEIVRESIDTEQLVKSKKSPGTRMVVTLQEETNELNASKQALSVAPNFIHSLDATAMRMTALRCTEAGLSTMCVHDSFACHAADYDTMQRITREVAHEIASKDLLTGWLEQVTLMLDLAVDGEKLKGELHEKLIRLFGDLTPPRGTLRVDRVLNSSYFFA